MPVVSGQALVLSAPETFELRQIDLPDPAPGEVRLRVHGCGICGSDKVLAKVSRAGTVLGHEVVAEVESCGAGVSGWQPGMRAVPVGDSIGMGENGRLGGFSEWLTVAAGALVPVPDRVSSRDAVLAEPMGNGLHFVRRARLAPGQRVAILGAGQIGLAIVFWARRLGAGRIAVSEPVARRAEAARALGADAVIDPAAGDRLGEAMAAALGGRPQVVFEATGRAAVMREAMRLVGGGGGVVVLAGITLDEVPIRPVSLALKETDLVFPLGTIAAEVEEVLDVLARGELPADRFLSHRIRQAEAPAALRDLGRPTDQIKVAIGYPAGERP